MMTKLIFGCGYLGGRVARRWVADGRTVFAVTRSARRAQQLEQEGLRPIVADVTHPDSLAGLPSAETVLYSIGYDRQGGASRHAVYVGGLKAVLDALPSTTGRIIYTSSTGVFGQNDGSWVDEDSPCRPAREAGLTMLASEQMLMNHPLSGRVIILRLAGLYGPKRIAKMADVLAGKPIAAPVSGHLNLIHVDDAVAVVLAAETRAAPPRTYLVADGHPTEHRTFYRRLAELLGVPCPEFLDPLCGDRNAGRRLSDKRAGNARMLAELGVKLDYPSYREGLAAIVATESASD